MNLVASYTRGEPRNPELSLGGWPLVVQASPARWVFSDPIYIGVPSGVVRGCIWLQGIFLKTLSMCLPISWWVIHKCTCPHRAECSAVFDQNQHDPHILLSLFTQSCSELPFSVSPDEKSPQRETFFLCGRGETKNSRNPKRYQNQGVKNCFEQWKKVSIGVSHPMEGTLKVTEV